jgi:hypothetical protein
LQWQAKALDLVDRPASLEHGVRLTMAKVILFVAMVLATPAYAFVAKAKSGEQSFVWRSLHRPS